MGKYKCIFSEEQEVELVEYVQHMESRLFGLTTTELRRLAFQLAEKNQLPHNFNRESESAGLDWLKGFLKRHKNLSLRSPEPTSAARAMGFNKVAVDKFFDLLTTLTDKYSFRPTRIYNVDETGLTTVPKSHSKVIAMKGRRQVGTLSSGERGQLVTSVLSFSAAGNYVPPFLIFPRVRMKAELLDGTPAETAAACHPSGWMQSNIFVEWLQHFIQHVKPTVEDPVLLLLDGHSTHTKNIPLIDLARKNGIILLCFPPHCTHRLQPLDVSFMAPLNTFYSQEVKTWLRANPGRVVTQFQIGSIFGKAYNRAASIQTAVSGFRKTGICPTDRNVFGEADFAAAETTEREEQIVNPEEILENIGEEIHQPTADELVETTAEKLPKIVSQKIPKEISQISPNDMCKKLSPVMPIFEGSPVAGPSGTTARKNYLITEAIIESNFSLPNLRINGEITPEKSISNLDSPIPVIKPSSFYGRTISSSFIVSPSEVIAVPHANRKLYTNKRVRGKTAILTESPYKNELEAVIAARKKQTKTQNIKRKVMTQKGNKGKKTKKVHVKDTSSEAETDDDDPHNDNDAFCLYCKEPYSRTKSIEGWIKCRNINCKNWAHESCTKWLDDDMDGFVCKICEDQ